MTAKSGDTSKTIAIDSQFFLQNLEFMNTKKQSAEELARKKAATDKL